MAELEKNSNKDIRLHDKEFKIFISSSEISIIIENLAKKINNSKIHNPIFIVIINGAFLFAADLLRKVKLPNTEVSFLKLSSYSGTKTTSFFAGIIFDSISDLSSADAVPIISLA